MSGEAQTVIPLSISRSIDPRLDFNPARSIQVVHTSPNQNYTPVNASSSSNQSTTFSFSTPSEVAIDRVMYLQMPVTFAFTGPGGNVSNVILSGRDSPRAYPLHSTMNNLNLTINGSSTVYQPNQSIQQLLRFYNGIQSKNGTLSSTPSMMDQAQNYGDLAATNRNPLAQYSNQEFDEPRGGFSMTTVSNTNVAATVTATFIEPLMISPLLYNQAEDSNASALVGVNNINIIITWQPDLQQMWSHDISSPSTITTLTVTLGTPVLYVLYLSQNPLIKAPTNYIYEYFNLVNYITTNSAPQAPNASTTIASSSIQLQTIPKRLYISVNQITSNRNYTSSDAFFGITNVSVNWNNQSGQLASASQQNLYEISVKNGLQMTWSQFSGISNTWIGNANTAFGLVGSVVCLEMGTDIPLPVDMAPGQSGSYQLQINVQCTNLNQTLTLTPQLNILASYEGTLSVVNNLGSGGTYLFQLGVFNTNNVADSYTAPQQMFKRPHNIYGGNFISDIGNFFKGVARELGPVLKTGLELAPSIIKGVQALGAGYAPKRRSTKYIMR